MKKFLCFSILCVFVAGVSIAQEQAAAPAAKADPSILKEFTRSAKINGTTMSFVLVTEKTADVLFEGPIKYSLKTRARMATLFYIQGTPEKDMDKLDMAYTMEQGGQSFEGKPQNIKNFQGGAVTKGTRIDGLVQFETKIDPSQPFVVKNANTPVEFKLSKEALKLMTN
jgi:hypothetical protein